MDLPSPETVLIDTQLKEQLELIRNSLHENQRSINLPPTVIRRISADGFEILDLDDNRILAGGYWLPVYFPRNRPLPRQGTSLYHSQDDLFLVRTDAGEHLLSVSTQSIGDLRALVALFLAIPLIFGISGYISATTLLRKYFLFSQTHTLAIEQALKKGEGPDVEFKRSLPLEGLGSMDQILQTVAAFANSGDGTIFIGIDDGGQIKGIPALTPKQRDQYSQRIHDAVRQRIKPSPSIQVGFSEIKDFTVCKVLVPRGEEPLHFLDGVIYVRYGASDVKAQPEMVKKILTEYVF